jgi:hypothetical protein
LKDARVCPISPIKWIEAEACLAEFQAHLDEHTKANASAVAAQGIQRIAWLYKIEGDARQLTSQERLQMRRA